MKIMKHRIETTEMLKLKLEAFTTTRNELNGKCGEACPTEILPSYFGNDGFKRRYRYKLVKTMCAACAGNFHDIDCLFTYEECPCHRKPDTYELLNRLDKYIEELEDALSKRLC